jgi:hypothetical protein
MDKFIYIINQLQINYSDQKARQGKNVPLSTGRMQGVTALEGGKICRPTTLLNPDEKQAEGGFTKAEKSILTGYSIISLSFSCKF